MAARPFSANTPGYGAPHSSPFRLSWHSQYQSSPRVCLSSKSCVRAPSPCLHQHTHVSAWSTQDGGMDRPCRCLFALPATNWLLHSEAPFMSQPISPLVRALPRLQHFSPSAPSQGCRSRPASTFASSFFFFFLLSYLVTWRSFLSFQVFEVFC